MLSPKKLHLTRKTLIIAVVLALVLAGGGVFAYRQMRPDPKKLSQPGSQPLTNSGDDQLNLNPPTDEEKSETDKHKDDLAKPDNSGQPTGGNKTVTVSIVDASQYGQEVEVRAFVSGVFEDGGTCKVVFTQGNHTVSKQTAGFKDATTTSCTPLTVSRAEFPAAGDWTVTVTYASSTANGSATKTVRLQ